jgi:hypothetical protein
MNEAEIKKRGKHLSISKNRRPGKVEKSILQKAFNGEL